ncbi:MAG: hypothetical protein LBB81_10840 [Treponema sp.]|jgi:hypothetical protein|nr:hypothetical protein [Treponema sp.]
MNRLIMSIAVMCFTAQVFIVPLLSCTTAAFVPETAVFTGGGTDISARGALGRAQAAPSGPPYTGDGGRDIRLAIIAPETQGDVPDYLPIYVQGLLNNNFGRYSAVNLIDRQNLDRIISEQNIAANGSFSDQDFVSIGRITNAQYFLFGTIQRLSGERYALQFSVTDSVTGIRKAGFITDGSLAQLEGRGALINAATADLLDQLGVKLTETGRQTLLAGNSSVVRAEAGVARGITALAGGDEVEALFNITQAVTFDPSNLEALSRINALSSSISGGTISQRIVNDIQARERWLDVFKETARFFNDHPPFEITFDPNLVQIGQIDYGKHTANIGMMVALDPSEAGFTSLNTLLEGLEKTGRRGDWGFSGWPLLDINPRTAGTTVFGGGSSFKYRIDAVLLNENGKNLGGGSVTLTAEAVKFSAGDKRVYAPAGAIGTVQFPNVRAEDLTPALTIVITSVNGIPAGDLIASGYMKIDPGDLERKEQDWSRQESAKLARAQWEREQAAARTKQKITSAAPYIVVGVVAAGLIIWLVASPPKNRDVTVSR